MPAALQCIITNTVELFQARHKEGLDAGCVDIRVPDSIDSRPQTIPDGKDSVCYPSYF